MSLRLIEIYHHAEICKEVDFTLKDAPVLSMWHDQLNQDETITKVLISAQETDTVLDVLQDYCADKKSFRVVILPVEATLPRPEEPSEEPKEETTENEKSRGERISIEELYQKMSVYAKISKKFVVMAALAAFVAAIGLLKDDVAVIIGSMVIAPLLSPNMALSLATTLSDAKLAERAMRTNLLGFFIVLSIGLLMGFIMPVDPETPQIAARSDVSHFYIFVALATGVAGAYSISTGVAEALVGVMVAVALLPPLVAAGLMFGAQYWSQGFGALLLFFVNVVSINLSGVLTFAAQGIRPQKWWEAENAKKAVRISLSIWFALLVLLAVLIFIEQKKRGI